MMEQLISMRQGRLMAMITTVLLLLGTVGCGDDDGGDQDAATGNDSGPASCGDGVVDPGETCDDGTANSDTEPDACRSNCQDAGCGDGVTDTGEGCDDGSANSNSQPDACRTDCQLPSCGDGVIDTLTGEQCDDGGTADGDGCDALCITESCGNGVVQTAESCDDGNTVSGDGCSADCLSNEECGNNYVDGSTGETCDDGNAGSHDGCSSGCLEELHQWTQLSSVGMTSRMFGAMTYDRARAVTVVWGGQNNIGYISGVSEFDGTGWDQPTLGTEPPLRQMHNMVYDEARGVVVLFGGQLSTGFHGDDTWEYNGTSWTQRFFITRPSARRTHGMTFDAARGVVVLFGGLNGTTDQNDTWEYDGVSWTQVTTSTSPPALATPALAFDRTRNVVVLMVSGKTGTGGNPHETWEYDGSDWTQLNPTVVPTPPRRNTRIIYDEEQDVILMYAGEDQGYYSDTWMFDGATWSDITPAATPPIRSSACMIYDASRKRLFIHGGITWNGPVGDTWSFSLSSSTPDESCADSTDNDGDQLTDCNDPDCDLNPACHVCGDTICGAIENCGSCPADCCP